MKQASGGIVKLDDIHKIGDDHYSHCVPFPDPDYTLDAGLIHPDTNIPPITINMMPDMTPEQIKEIEEEIRKQVRTKIKLQKFLY